HSTPLRAAGDPGGLRDGAVQAQSKAAPVGAEVALLGQPGHGVLQVSIQGGDEGRVAHEVVLPLRQGLEAEGGSLVVERGPIELKSKCEAWGSINLGILEIMKRIKGEFDPGDVLSPRRFVGGL